MSEFKVCIRDLNNATSEYDRLAGILSQASQSVRSVKQNLRLQVAQRERINSRLNSSASLLSEYQNTLRSFHKAAQQVIALYQANEEKCVNVSGAKFSPDPLQNLPTKGTPAPSSTIGWPEILNRIFKDVFKIVGSTGVIGSSVSLGYSIATSNVGSTMKGISKLIGETAKLADNSTGGNVSWLDVFKWTKSEDKGFLDNLSDQFKKYSFGENPTAWKKTSTVAKWAGDVITVGTTWYDNYKEYNGDMGNLGMWAETIVESALDIGSGIAIGAVVAAALGGAPVLVVGAATAAAGVFVDWVGDALLGGDWKETVSDGIIKGVSWIGNAVGDVAKKASQGIANWFKKLW